MNQPDRRKKDCNWWVSEDGNGCYPDVRQGVFVALLMDLRDELKIIGRKLSALECSNFIRIPHTLKAIQRNTAKPKKKRRIP